MAENRCNCEQATCYPDGPCGHEEVDALRARVAVLEKALEPFVHENPWDRAPPADGDMTTDEPWVCYGCNAEIPYIHPPLGEVESWEMPGIGCNAPLPTAGEHGSSCRWVKARAALAPVKP